MNGDMVSRLQLDPEPASAAKARVWLRASLADWSEPACDTAELLVSELVTNAVLHARTVLELRLSRDGNTTRVDVVDANPALPVVKEFGAEAATGRGLHLLGSLAAAWGVEAALPGKRVWFELIDGAVQGAVADAPDLGAWPDLDVDVPEPQRPDGSAADVMTIRILELPVEEYLFAEAHNDALIREFTLIAEEAPGADVPWRLREMAGEFTARFGSAVNGVRRQVQDAVESGRPTVDLHVEVPRASGRFLVALSALLDEADRWCEEGNLLTLASAPRIRRFRAWYREQVESQLAGASPTPWGG